MILNLIRYYIENIFSVLKTPSFWYPRLAFYVFYFGKRVFNQKNPSLIYGETPYPVWKLLASHIKLSDRVIDLGCGRGVGLFYLASLIKARYLGVEYHKEFVSCGNKIAKICHYPNIQFIHKDLTNYTLPECDVIFLAGTCFDDKLLHILSCELNRIKPRKILSISTCLVEYGLKGYKITEESIRMPWGITSLYIMS